MEAYKEMVRLEEADRPEGQPIERRAPMNNKVWVIHGHDLKARDVIFALLTAVGLQPLEFDQAADLTGKPSPSIMDILRAAFREGQAFVALLTPDENAVPSAAFAETGDPGPHPQPRPNVVLEAGMAFAYDTDRTILLEMGRIREISDLAGIHSVKWRHDNPETRRRLIRKLKLAKCPVDDSGDHWMRAGGTYP
jgi:predicted nucleotide-binding protein